MDVERLASPWATTVAAAILLCGFGAYFVVRAFVPDLFGQWPLYAVAAVVAGSALTYGVGFAARALVADEPGPWRVADLAVAAISLLLLGQAGAFAFGTPARLTADTGPVAFVHLALWTGLVSTFALVAAALRTLGDADLTPPAAE